MAPFSSFTILLCSALACASPLEPRQVDTSTHCGQFDVVPAGSYSLLLNQWGAASATSGQACANLVSENGDAVAWTTTWTWAGPSGVKSFTNIQQNTGLNKQLSAIQSIPSTWTWSQAASGSIVADVAYDLFTANSAGGANVNEIMIWLANINAGPISFEFDANGNAIPVATNINLAGHTWNLFSGSNGANNVFSFLPTSGQVTNFSGDINTYLKFLTQTQGVSTSQFLVTAQGGTEASLGSATLTTSAYSLLIN